MTAYASAYTDEQGKYELIYTEARKGALLGKHAVTVRTSAVDEIEIEDKSTGLMVTPPLPEGYVSRAEYQFERDVSTGRNLHDFELVTPVSVPDSDRRQARKRREFL